MFGNKAIKILGVSALFISALCIMPAWAERQAATVLEDEELLMGKTVRMTVDIPVPSDTTKVTVPILAEAKGRKFVGLLNDTIEIGVKPKETVINDGNYLYRRFEFTVQAFDSGTYKLPPIVFDVNGEQILSKGQELTVLPVKVKADDKIDPFSDIAEPFEVNPVLARQQEEQEAVNTLVWWLIACTALLLVLIICLILRYRKTGRILPHREVPLYKRALQRLRKLHNQHLPQRDRTKEYYTKLTDILRQYINGQFGVKTFEKTTHEILVQLSENTLTAQFEPQIKSILETADFVKFAKIQPTEEENERCMEEAIRFIELSHDTVPVEDKDEEGPKKEGGDK